MARFKFTVTRNITESATIEVDAPTIEEAHQEGLRKANAFEVEGWETDDTISGDAYLPDPSDFTTVETTLARTGRKRSSNGKGKA